LPGSYAADIRVLERDRRADLLGRWQRVFFAELDGPREREVSVLVFGESASVNW